MTTIQAIHVELAKLDHALEREGAVERLRALARLGWSREVTQVIEATIADHEAANAARAEAREKVIRARDALREARDALLALEAAPAVEGRAVSDRVLAELRARTAGLDLALGLFVAVAGA